MQKFLKRGWSWLTFNRTRKSFTLSVLILGMLLWSRLIMVSNMPRTAVAGDEHDLKQASSDMSSDKQGTAATQVNHPGEPNPLPLGDRSKGVSKTSVDNRMIREEGKSGPHEADKPEQEALRSQSAMIRDAVLDLRLESIMLGRHIAVINGRVYREGSGIEVQGYESLRLRLVEVRKHSVIISCMDRRFELRKYRP